MEDERELARIAAVGSLGASAAILVRGRVLEAERVDGVARALVADASGQAWFVTDTDVERGAIVLGAALLRDGVATLADVRVIVAAAPHGLHANGDVRTLLAKGRLARIETRAQALRSIRAFFEARGSIEVETPTLVSNPGMDVHLDAFAVPSAEGGRYLGTSPEYAMKRLVAAGLERIHQITRAYRRDEIGALHEPEFTILEWYRAYASAEDVMRETEELVAHVVAACNGGSTRVVRGSGAVDFAPPWERRTVRDAVLEEAGLEVRELLADETRLFEVLGTTVQEKLGYEKPTWLVDWPIELASLARPKDGEPRLAERFEAYAFGVELCNGFGELTDSREQRARFESDLAARRALGKDVYPIDEAFLRALEDGLPPSAGNAVGVDRVVMLATGAACIADVRAFGVRDV